MSDILIKALLNGEAAVYACDTSNMAESARQIHDTTPVGTIILGRTVAATVMMCATLKNKRDKLTLMLNGGGPAGTVMAVGNADLKVKSCIANPHVNMPPSSKGGFDIGGAVGTDGLLTVIKDMGLRRPFIGKVALQTGEVGEDVAYYYLISEQQPSIVYVNTWLETDMSVVNAGGLMITPMPGCSEKTLAEIESRTGAIANYAVYLIQENPEEILYRIFEGMELSVLERKTPVLECDCGRERLGEALVSLGEEELCDMLEKDKGAQITCQFCNKIYDFSAAELEELLRYAKHKGNEHDGQHT